LSDEAEYTKLLWKLFQTPTEIMEVFKVLIFWKDIPQAPIYCGSTKTLVSICHILISIFAFKTYELHDNLQYLN
jgi:hypothetical protein